MQVGKLLLPFLQVIVSELFGPLGYIYPLLGITVLKRRQKNNKLCICSYFKFAIRCKWVEIIYSVGLMFDQCVCTRNPAVSQTDTDIILSIAIRGKPSSTIHRRQASDI